MGRSAPMRLRMELFVDALDVSVAFYTGVLGFRVDRRDENYVSVRRGSVVFGLGPVATLPEDGAGPGFTRRHLAAGKGVGVEIVLELDDIERLTALYDHCRAHTTVVEDLQLRPWGLWDFRIVDPDGYYLRLTHGDEAASSIARLVIDG